MWGICEFCVECESENFGRVSVWERSVVDCECWLCGVLGGVRSEECGGSFGGVDV